MPADHESAVIVFAHPFYEIAMLRRFMPKWPAAVAWLVLTGSVGAQTVIGRFTLKERFGVFHPEQPVEFAYSGGNVHARNLRMLAPGGEEVPFQQLSTGAI